MDRPTRDPAELPAGDRWEVEVKHPVPDPAALRQRLEGLGARPRCQVEQTDWMFDTPDHSLRRTDCGLRVRQWRAADATASDGATGGAGSTGGDSPHSGGPRRAGASLTWKGPRHPGPTKQRQEIETPVDDPESLIQILKRLGLRPTVILEKRRQTWSLGACTCALDELPQLGWWLEIEGPDAAQVQTVCRQLGLPQAGVPDTYVEMAARSGQVDADGCVRLLFDVGGPRAA